MPLMSMNDVAKLVGVSHVTVSRVVNGQPGVSEATARKVRRAMKSLGYVPRPPNRRPGPRRRTPSRKRAAQIAMLMLDEEAMLHAHFLQTVFRGVELAIEYAHMTLAEEYQEQGRWELTRADNPASKSDGTADKYFERFSFEPTEGRVHFTDGKLYRTVQVRLKGKWVVCWIVPDGQPS